MTWQNRFDRLLKAITSQAGDDPSADRGSGCEAHPAEKLTPSPAPGCQSPGLLAAKDGNATTCSCAELVADLFSYGTHVCQDGRRIAPEDFYRTLEYDEWERANRRFWK